MPTAISTPDFVGFRADFSATIAKIDGQEFIGYKSVEGGRKRTRGVVRGANADQLGKTRGTNEYTLTMEIYIAEFKAFVIDHFGVGYGDVMFPVEIAVTEQGYDTQNYRFKGCTIDDDSFSFAQGTDALTMKLDFAPMKMIMNNVDDNAQPLGGAPSIG